MCPSNSPQTKTLQTPAICPMSIVCSLRFFVYRGRYLDTLEQPYCARVCFPLHNGGLPFGFPLKPISIKYPQKQIDPCWLYITCLLQPTWARPGGAGGNSRCAGPFGGEGRRSPRDLEAREAIITEECMLLVGGASFKVGPPQNNYFGFHVVVR